MKWTMDSNDECVTISEKKASTHFSQTQKGQNLDLPDFFGIYFIAFLLSDFNTAENDTSLKKKEISDTTCSPRFTGFTNSDHEGDQVASFKFGDVQLPDVKNSLGENIRHEKMFFHKNDHERLIKVQLPP